MKNKILLSKEQMKNIFNDMVLYFNNPYQNYSKDDIGKIVSLYYNSLKYYKEDDIRFQLQKYIEKNRYFPKVCDLIPTNKGGLKYYE